MSKFLAADRSSLKIVHDDSLTSFLENGVDEFDVGGVGLVVVLGLFVGKGYVEGDLVGLIDDGAMASGHFAGVEMQRAGNGAEIFFDAGQQLVGGLRIGGGGPEYDNV